MKNKNINLIEIIKPAAILVAVCVVMTGLLAAAYSITKEPIEQAKINLQTNSVRQLLPADEYREIDGEPAFLAIKNGRAIGCIITASANGYGGEISVMTAFFLDGTVKNLKILSMSETPGVGTKTTNPEFLRQFINAPGPTEMTSGSDASSNSDIIPSAGDTAAPDNILSDSDAFMPEIPEEAWAAAIKEYIVGTPIDSNSRKIDAITGATISSRAVCSAVTKAAQIYDRLLDNGKLRIENYPNKFPLYIRHAY